MLSKKYSFYSAVPALLAAAALAVSLVCAGCQSTENAVKHSHHADMANGKELAQWRGEWQLLGSVADAEELNGKYAETARTLPHYTEEGFKSAIKNAMSSPIVGITFDGTNTLILTVRDASGNDKIVSSEYRYLGEKPMKGVEGRSWHTFEAVKPVRGLSKAQYFIATLPHQHGEGLTHWYARFGAHSIDALVDAEPSQMAVFVDAALPRDVMITSFQKGIDHIVRFLPKEPFAPYHGKWINNARIYHDLRPKVQEVYTKLIKEFAGKNPKGGDYTKEDIIALAAQTFGNAETFTHLEFIASDDKNELIVWKDSVKLSHAAYKQAAANPIKPHLKAFASQDSEQTGLFTHFSITAPHGKPMHVHLWYGAVPADIGNVSGVPTCVPANLSEEDVALHVMNSCRKLLQDNAK